MPRPNESAPPSRAADYLALAACLVALGVSSMWIDLLHPLNSAVG